MMTPSIEAVVAGSKGFALALLAPLTERIGTRPRVASDPSQALAFCRGPSGLVVVEFLGEDSLRTIKDLVLQGEGLRIVAAVAEAHAAAEEPLRALGVELARWDGKPGAVLAAVARQLVAAAIDGPPELPRATTTSPAPRAAAPIAPPPMPAKAIPASRAPSPARPSEPARSVPAVPPLPRATPTPAAPPPVPVAARPADGPALAAAPSLIAMARDGASAEAAGDLFSDVAPQEDFDVDLVHEPAAQPLAAAPFAPVAVWPTNVPSTAEAAEALARGLAGLFDPPGTPFAGVAEIVEGLSELERAVFAGEPQAVDCEPVRRAAEMRVRVGAALATAPAEGGAVDAGAVSAFLAEIDALLSEVNALAASAPAELQPSLEAVRNSLVREAIDFSEASHRGALAEQPAAAPVPTRAVRETRVVSMASEAEAAIEAAQGKRQRSMVVALALSAVVAAGFHGYTFLSSRAVEPPVGVGPISNGIASEAPGGGRIVHSVGGVPFDPEQVKRLTEEEALKGNTVREMAAGVLMIVPGAAPDTRAPGPTGPSPAR